MSIHTPHQHVLDFIAEELPSALPGGLPLRGERTLTALVLSQDTSEQEWEAWGDLLQRAGEGLDWHIGDWLLFGEEHFPGRNQKSIRYRQLATIVRVKIQQLQNIVSVTRRFPPSRRHAELSFSHHEQVCVLNEQQQDQLLTEAFEKNWSVNRLKIEKRDIIRKRTPSIFGDRFNFRGLIREPINEQGVVFLFGMVAAELGFEVEAIRTGFPDCIAKRKVQPGRWQELNIEFEFRSSNFIKHRHSVEGCDIVVCWLADRLDHLGSIKVLSLEKVIKTWPKAVSNLEEFLLPNPVDTCI